MMAEVLERHLMIKVTHFFLADEHVFLEIGYNSDKKQVVSPVQVRTTHWLLFSNNSKNYLYK